MIEVAIMVEGQNGLNWANWQRLARAVEDLGFAGLYRSDHYTNANPPDKDSLELWISLAWLASHTRRIQFGPLVSPVSFRHPTMTARMAAAVDDLSGGRLVLGLGAGWQEREHTNYGWDLLDMDRRFARFEEGLEVITRLLHSDIPIDYSGSFYTIKEGILLPRPSRPDGPPILIGGNGQRRTLPLVARYAAEWNAVYILPDEFSRLSAELDVLVQQQGREPRQVRRSLMTGGVLGRDRAEVERKVEARTQGKRTAEDLRQHGVIVGTPAEFREQLAILEQSGVQRVMLQWLDLDDLVGLEALAKAIRVE
jgi:F420-dependent oxidoreductase-like protein